MEGIESEGKTVAQAVENALKKTGLRRDQVEVLILQEAAAGFMGLGGRNARVRIAEKRWGAEAPAPARMEGGQAPRKQTPAAAAVDPQKACHAAKALAAEILGLMGFKDAVLSAEWDDIQERLLLKVDSADAKKLASGDGRTLEAMQFLLSIMLNRRLGASVAIQLDALGYWAKKENEIMEQVQRGIDLVKSSHKPYRLPPMEPAMRRLVHRRLADHPDIVTASEGEGSWRKIVIKPR
ncbi:MAG: Jag N-terminal domain-containing protein [Elusimicrobia bacterium]|nr:Jag N-terminal domain-containing protein [Elusimicrobiota bacterium]